MHRPSEVSCIPGTRVVEAATKTIFTDSEELNETYP